MNENAAQLLNMAEVRSPISSVDFLGKWLVRQDVYSILLCVRYVTEEFWVFFALNFMPLIKF